MANFLITTAGSLVQGTSENDLFVLNTALNVAAYGNDGNDVLSAAGAINGTNATLNGGAGNDSIYLTAGVATLTLAKTYAGAGDDVIVADAAASTNSILNGGGGADTIQLSGGTFATDTLNGNAGADYVTASATTFSASFLGLGAGADTFNFVSANFGTSTLVAGGGADTISGTINGASAFRIEADVLGDDTYYGNDTVRIGGTTLGSAAFVQGGGGADVIAISAAIGSTSTINGNAGKDSIVLSAIVAGSTQLLVDGGIGADSIQVSAALAQASATIAGGSGEDVINVSGALASTGAVNQIAGGADADAIGLGQIFSGTSTQLRYNAFTESNISAFDTVSAAGNGNANFDVTQSTVNFASGQSLNVGAFTTNTGGVVTFVSAAGNSLTARAEQMDTYLSEGQTVIFANGAGTQFLFTQGGAQNSGLGNDLLVQLNNTFTAAATSGGLILGNNSSYTVQVA